MAMTRYLVFRLVGVAITLLIITAITYGIFYILPSDPALLSCGRPCTPESLERVSAFMGTDLPWWQQLWDYLSGIFVGRTFGEGASVITCAAPCFGYSFQQHVSVTDLIVSSFPVTASIAIGAGIVWLIFGISGGVLAALRRGSVLDRGVMTVAVAGVSAPIYVVGMLAILLFGFALRWAPTGGYIPIEADPWQWFLHLVLPWCTLAFFNAAVYARLTRSEMLETMGLDYVRTARAKGLGEPRVVVRHGLRNALLPVVTVLGLDLGALLGGTIVVEQVFSMQGLGLLLLDAVHRLDLQVIVGFTLFAAMVIVFANFAIDLVYGLVDPRVSVVG